MCVYVCVCVCVSVCIYIYIYIYIYVYISSSCGHCMDSIESLISFYWPSHFVNPLGLQYRQRTDESRFRWSVNTGMSMCSNPEENVLTSPAEPSMSGSS